MLKYISPSIEAKNDILAYRHEILLSDKNFDGCAGLGNFSSIEDWLMRLSMLTPGATLRGCFPTLVYLAYCDDLLIGMLNIRLSNDEFLRKYAGHIGYNVRPSARKKGFAHEMLENAILLLKTNGIFSPTICTETDNIPSQKTALSCGFIPDGEEKLKNGEMILRFVYKN